MPFNFRLFPIILAISIFIFSLFISSISANESANFADKFPPNSVGRFKRMMAPRAHKFLPLAAVGLGLMTGKAVKDVAARGDEFALESAFEHGEFPPGEGKKKNKEGVEGEQRKIVQIGWKGRENWGREWRGNEGEKNGGEKEGNKS